MISNQMLYNLPRSPLPPLTQVLFKKHSILAPHIHWLKQQDTLIAKILKTGLSCLEIFTLSLTIVGLSVVLKGLRISKKIDAYKLYSQAPDTIPSYDRIPALFKNKQQAFSHTHEFTVAAGSVWYRPICFQPSQHYHPIQNEESWKQLYFDGLEEQCQAAEISADGANLIVICNKGDVHYKKSIRELRVGEHYSFLDKCQKDNWKPKWFALPVISSIWNLFTKPRLKLPKDCLAWDISHRGQFNYYYTDTKDHDHIDLYGITTLYALTKNSEIFYADAWLPGGFNYKIPPIPFAHAPLKNLSASASTIFVVDAENAYFTAELDFDILGKDPLFSYYTDPKKNLHNKIFLPPKGWTKQPSIPLDGQTRTTSNITIFQTDQMGNQARILRVEGSNHEGLVGYFVKTIEAPTWNFIPLIA